ncbi:MAG: tetratricopeptide repeat protein [Polyangiaceae bacterium]
MLAARQGDDAQSAAELRAARASFGEDAALLFSLAAAEVRLGRFEAAIDPLRALVAQNPAHPQASALLGLCHVRVEQWEEAAQALGRAVALGHGARGAPAGPDTLRDAAPPGSGTQPGTDGGGGVALQEPEVHELRVQALDRLGRAAERLAALEQAARTFPTNAGFALLLAAALEAEARDDEAIAALEGARPPLGAPAPAMLGSSATLGVSGPETKQAEVTARLAALYLARGRREAAAGRAERALESGRASLALGGDPTEAAIFVGRLHAERGQHAEAAALFERALDARLDSVDAMCGAATAYLALGRTSAALAPLRRAARVDPTRLDVLGLLASALTTAGETQEALLAHGEVLRLAPNDGEALLQSGRLAASLGRHEEARSALERALVVRPDDKEVLLALASVRQQLGLGEPACRPRSRRRAPTPPTPARSGSSATRTRPRATPIAPSPPSIAPTCSRRGWKAWPIASGACCTSAARQRWARATTGAPSPT